VFDKSLQEATSLESLPENLKKVIVPSMFPPSEEEAKEMCLERSFRYFCEDSTGITMRKFKRLCSRIFPYDQNSGGFFVAVLRKVKSGDGSALPTR